MGAEGLSRRCKLATRSLAVVGVGDRPSVAEWKAEVQTGGWRVVELVGRQVVAQHVAAVVGEPQLVRSRIPIEAHGVPYTAGEYLPVGLVGFHPQNSAVWPV